MTCQLHCEAMWKAVEERGMVSLITGNDLTPQSIAEATWCPMIYGLFLIFQKYAEVLPHRLDKVDCILCDIQAGTQRDWGIPDGDDAWIRKSADAMLVVARQRGRLPRPN